MSLSRRLYENAAYSLDHLSKSGKCGFSLSHLLVATLSSCTNLDIAKVAGRETKRCMWSGITGDAARNKVQTMPGGGCATARVELPRNWNQLMEELGYDALKEFYIK